jgi:predicted ATPase
MKIIKSIEIKKFRSIKSIVKNFDLGDLTVLVGQNDNGKSNILRALNLFFTNQTDSEQNFRFNDDYCYHANSGTGSRREIRIDLTVSPPTSRFKNAELIRWTKRWKPDGSIIESRIIISSGKQLAPKDNVYKWLDKLKYRYVPAIKGQNYFNSLMGELHDALTVAHSKVMDTQGKGFISGIQKVTSAITKELNNQIGIPNAIQVPSDFKQLFSNLDFGAQQGENTYHLKQRGDGIKVRHIPVILKYMAEEERNISIPGYVKPDTIWGFEEPENNLEMRYAFELAQTFKRYSKDIQIITTTHSPAFYSLSSDSTCQVNKFFVAKDESLCSTATQIQSRSNDDLHEKMGLLPLITPYLEDIYKAQSKIESLEKELDNLKGTTKVCVITEDTNNNALQIILKSNGFDMNKTEIFSYDGKDSIKGARILAKYLKSKNPIIEVIVHRDSDYLSVSELEELDRSFKSHGIKFFRTIGVDTESHFLTLDHLKSLNLGITEDKIVRALEQATEKCRKDSLKRFINHHLKTNPPKNQDFMGEINKIEVQYQENIEKFRYGKKVLGYLKSNLQKITCTNVNIEKESNALHHPMLLEVAKAFNQ